MAAKSPQRRRLSASVAAIERHNGPGDPRVGPLRRELDVESLAEHIERVVNTEPPLSAAQRERLALALAHGAEAVARAC